MSSIEELFVKYNHDVFHFLVYMGVNQEQAEDLVQEVFMRVLKTKSGFKGNSSEKTWLYTIARNIAFDHFRKQKGINLHNFYANISFFTEMKDDSVLPEDVTLQKEVFNWINDCLQVCTVDQRMVIINRYLYEMSIVETAAYLGWTESKVKITQHRALKVLRKTMEKDEKTKGLYHVSLV
ncbi:sigma-70 family RNA polymerase sigma factor [Niallia sp. 01092]|uniref:sigma-70 family RNA polymerase sigma factor n=1 Tax=unclassified Niallia TaxID=2837522 RepID=UPI003FCFEABC